MLQSAPNQHLYSCSMQQTQDNSSLINHVFDTLKQHYGHFDWWHRDKPYEVMLGAILVQNTNWKNAEKALNNLGERLSPRAIAMMPEDELGQLIRPSGYYNQKAKKIKALNHWFEQYDYKIQKARAVDLPLLRDELLAIKGVGYETADAILVYAIGKPSFVIDAFTRRIFTRNKLTVPKGYEAFRVMMEESLPLSTELYAYYHGLMVEHAQQFCKKTPLCQGCPLSEGCLKSDPE